jgi:hypothetical protein
VFFIDQFLGEIKPHIAMEKSRVIRPSRGHWRPGEDDKLRQLVDKYGPQNWNSIAENLEGRSGMYLARLLN